MVLPGWRTACVITDMKIKWCDFLILNVILDTIPGRFEVDVRHHNWP